MIDPNTRVLCVFVGKLPVSLSFMILSALYGGSSVYTMGESALYGGSSVYTMGESSLPLPGARIVEALGEELARDGQREAMAAGEGYWESIVRAPIIATRTKNATAAWNLPILSTKIMG